jgi:trk system potassium uptake protein TrkH
VKTTTLFVLYRLFVSSVKNSKHVLVFGRRIPQKVVEGALLVLAFYLTWVCFASYLILLFQPQFSLQEVLFEVISAMSTVGLSLGITSQLAPLSKVVIIITMFLGRLGPLTIVSFLASRRRPLPFTFPSEEVIIG